jgi:cysteine-rich repeat protein
LIFIYYKLTMKQTFMYWKKVICTIMVAMMIVANIFQPVLAIGNFFDQFGAQAFLQAQQPTTTIAQLPTSEQSEPTYSANSTWCMSIDICGDGIDNDCDGLIDEWCPDTECPDTDNDGICNADDNCPTTYNPTQVDTDNDSIGDACDTWWPWCGEVEICGDWIDNDCDGLIDEWCTWPNSCVNQWWDTDGDGICNNQDNCIDTPNPNQQDSDNDDVGNVCDNCPTTYNPTQLDTDQDWIWDACEPVIDECPNPVTVTLTSHINNQTVNTQTVTLTWTVQWAVGSVVVIVWTTSYTATVVNGVWSATVQLQPGANNVWVKWMHTNGNQDCTYLLDIVLNYQSSVMCPNPVTVTLTSHTNNQTVNTQTVTLTWTVQWAVGSVVVIVWTTSYTATVVNGVWSATVQLQPWENKVWVKAMHTNGNPNCTQTIDLVLKYETTTLCPNPVTLTLISHTNNQTVNTQTVTLTWTVQWAVGSLVVIVWTTSYTATVVNGVWSATVQLQPGANNIWVKWMHTNGNPDCAYILDIVLIYQNWSNQCPNPINTILVTSHTYNQIVQQSVVPVLSGTVQWNAARVEVIVGGNTYVDTTIVNGVWSVENVLLPVIGQNPITINVYHANWNSLCSLSSYFQLIRSNHSIVTTCTETEVTPQEVVINNGEFTVTCEWAYVNYYEVKVTRPDWTHYTVSIPNWSNSVQVNPTLPGTYLFQCVAYGNPTAYCPIAKWLVTNGGWWQCVDPITSLTVSSHTNWQIVNNNIITLTWAVQWWVNRVNVMVWTTLYTATVQGNTRSATISLQSWANAVWVKAYPNDADCDPVQRDLIVTYKPSWVTTCTETAVDPTSVQLNNGFFTITCKWTNVNKYSVQVTLPNGTITYLNTWSTIWWDQFTYLPTTTWTYNFVCNATGLNDSICPSTSAVVTTWWWGWTCEAPVNYINIDTPTSWTIVSAWSVEIKWTVLPVGNVKKVIVWWVEATISGSVFTALIPLSVWTNTVLATVYSTDEDCGSITDTTTIIRQGTWGWVCDYPISLQVSQPSNNTSTSSSSITIKWVVTWSGAVLNIWSTAVPFTTSGDFTYTYPLVRGTQTITITAANSDIDCTQIVNLTVNRTWWWGGWWSPSSIKCGNNRLDSGEQCDDGNFRNWDGCSSSCQLERVVCGNNKIETGETCDDGNTRRGDWCNAICQLEDDIIKKVKMRPVPYTFTPPTVLPTILPKTGIALRKVPTRQLVN